MADKPRGRGHQLKAKLAQTEKPAPGPAAAAECAPPAASISITTSSESTAPTIIKRQSSLTSGGPHPSSSDGSRGRTAKTLQEVATKLMEVEVTPKRDPPVTYRGTGGKNVDLSVNYIRLEKRSDFVVGLYEVKFEPMVDNRADRFKMVKLKLSEVIGDIFTFDGHKLCLPRRLDPPSLVVSCPLPSDPKVEVHVRVSHLRDLSREEEENVQLFNNIIRRAFNELKMVEYKKKLFDPSLSHQLPQYKLEIWPGIVTAVDNYESEIYLQLDVAHRVLRQDTILEELKRISKTNKDIKSEAERQLIGTVVMTKYNNKSYTIDEFDFTQSPLSTFKNSKGEDVSYFDYYKSHYDIQIKDKGQPLLVSKSKRIWNGQKSFQLVCLIPELCTPTGMTDAMRADFKVMKDVGAFTRVTPDNRQKAMLKYVEAIHKNEKARTALEGWGLRLSRTPVSTTGRVLNPITLQFGKNVRETVRPNCPDWTRTATTKPVLNPVKLSKWALITPDKNKAVVQKFLETYHKVAKSMDIDIAKPRICPLPNDRTETYINELKGILDPSVQMVVTILPQLRADRYSAIKKLSCVDFSTPTQVILVKTISNEKRLNSVAQKIALQINCKVGGELWALQNQPIKNLMVVGIDVYHADKSHGAGSVAAIVATVDPKLTKYHSIPVFQRQGQELVDLLKGAFLDCLKTYYDANHAWPEQIVVFRDGVGDGQLEATKAHEANQFLSAFSHVEFSRRHPEFKGVYPRRYSPGLYYVVVQKRINTRIFLNKGNNKGYDNPMPGTVLDHTVTRYRYQDFFLIPQNVNQGTVTPTHFIVILSSAPSRGSSSAGSHGHSSDGRSSQGLSQGSQNGKALTATDIQYLAYALCHMYTNWTGTVRVPAPCQYAHKLADLVGEYIKREPSPTLANRLYYL